MAHFLVLCAMTFYEERDALGRVSFLQSVGTGIPADFILVSRLSVASGAVAFVDVAEGLRRSAVQRRQPRLEGAERMSTSSSTGALSPPCIVDKFGPYL
jgi:hypothetical protein